MTLLIPSNPASKSNLVKFRPVLTLEQIRHIVWLTTLQDAVDHAAATTAGIDPPDLARDAIANMNRSIKQVMIPLLAKIEVGAINPAYKLSETHAIKKAEISLRERYENNLMSPEEESEYETHILGV